MHYFQIDLVRCRNVEILLFLIGSEMPYPLGEQRIKFGRLERILTSTNSPIISGVSLKCWTTSRLKFLYTNI